MVTPKGVLATLLAVMAPQVKDATAPAVVAKELLIPLSSSAVTFSVTVGSTAPIETLPVQTPDANVSVAGVAGSAPACPLAVSVPVPAYVGMTSFAMLYIRAVALNA